MIDKALLASVIALLTLSLVMSYSLSVYTVVHFEYGDFHFFMRQGVAIVLGVMLMIALSKLDPDKWFVKIGLMLFLGFFLVMIVMQFLPESIVKAVGGAKRWIHFGSLSLAPVEFFKVGFVFFLAWSFSRKLLGKKEKISFFSELGMYMPYMFIFMIVVMIIAVFQKDLGQVVVLGATLMVFFFLVGSSWKFFLMIFLGIIGGIIGLIIAAPHRILRLKSWWGTVQDSILSLLPFDRLQQFRIEAIKEPYQISNSLNAIHNGGFWGTGLGNGQFKLGYLSEVHTDFILAGIIEELGFMGIFFVTGILFFIVYRIFMIAKYMNTPMYYFFSIGVGLLISFAFILNAYGISGMTPIKGIAVPFLSYGGSHILASCLAIGLVLMISKKIPRDIDGKIL